MTADIGRVFFVMVVAFSVAAMANAADDLEILTWSSGLVTGELEVEVDLGATGGPAGLFLNGAKVCDLTTSDSGCTVDLGEGLHVHLLELIRHRPGGGSDRAERWLNRPGREAGLEIELAARPIGRTCGGRLKWTDADGQDPVVLEVEAGGERKRVPLNSRVFGYPCAEPGESRVVTASAVFADGRRAEAVALAGESGHLFGEAPTAVSLVAASPALAPCGAVEARFGDRVRPTDRDGFEVVFVIDPNVSFRGFASSGAEESGGQSSWNDAHEAFADADGLWFVMPDSTLNRLDGFSEGHESWLGSFFRVRTEVQAAAPRLADAVAVAGLVAGATPSRRLVMLVLGSDAGRDSSRFTPAQTRAYLAEVGVPLVVFRTAGADADQWPAGVQVGSIAELAKAFTGVKGQLDQQCVEWFPPETRSNQIAGSLPAGIVVAGRRGETETVWRMAGGSETGSGERPISDEPVASEKIEVTAVTVLVRAQAGRGRPVTDLAVEDLAVSEDGHAVPVLALEPLTQLRTTPGEALPPAPAAPANTLPTRKIVPVAIYVERQLSGATDIAPALADLAERADWLTGLGPVDIAVADQGVEVVLAGANDPAVVRASLEELSSSPYHGHVIERIRTDYLRYIREYPDRALTREGGEIESSTPNNLLRVKTMTAARSAIFQEDAVLRMTMARMNDWALSLPATGPRLLIVVGAGFDEDPVDFYMRFLEQKDPSFAAAARAEFLRYNQATRVDAVGHELAAAGWLVVPVATRIAGSQRTAAEFSGGETFQSFLTDGVGDGAYIRDVEFMLMDPLGAQQHLAGPSGGKVVMGGRGLDRLIAESTGWYRLTYQVARAPDGAMHEVAVTSNRPDTEVRSTGVVVSGTSEGRSALRLRKLLEDPAEAGELPVRLAVSDPRPAEQQKVIADLTVTVDFQPIALLFVADAERVLRFSVAVRGDATEPYIHHRLGTAAGALGGMYFEMPIEWSKEDPAEVAVVVEDLGSGAWGGTVSRLGD